MNEDMGDYGFGDVTDEDRDAVNEAAWDDYDAEDHEQADEYFGDSAEDTF